MRKLTAALLALCLASTTAWAQQWQPDTNDKQELSVQKALVKAWDKNPATKQWFADAYAYAVLPRVGKGGIGIGGAYGKGLVIRGSQTVGKASMSQVTVGLQLGGQVYSEYILFEDETAFKHFTRGQFEFDAQVSAVAITAGASFDADYEKGVAVFTLADGGLMYEAAVGGQKFKYKPIE